MPVSETPTFKISTKTNTPSFTDTPSPTPFKWETPTPETLLGYPTALLPVEKDPFAKNVPLVPQELSLQQLYIGKYIIRNWCKDDESISSYCAITISALGEEQVEIWGFPVYLGVETGSDLTGNGYPNIVVIDGIGNAAGEVVVKVFEAGNTLKEILTAFSRPDIKFANLNNDKSVEFLGDARIWSQFSDCQALNLPYVLEYDTKTASYTVKTYKYNEILASNIQFALDGLATYKSENPNTEIPLCRVYWLVSAYLVSGQREKAWGILDENYSAEKSAEYKAGFLKDLGGYVPKP